MEVHKQHPKLLYPSMVIAAITVTVFSLLGIATLTGALPFAHSEPQTQAEQYRADVSALTGSASAKSKRDNNKSSESSASRDDGNAQLAAARCAFCGVVESVRAVEVKGQGTGIIGVAGGAYAGNEIEKSVHKHTSYRIRVRMSDDSIRTLYQRDVPGVASGDHVKIVDGSIVQQS